MVSGGNIDLSTFCELIASVYVGALPTAIAGIVAVLASFLTAYAIGARFSAGPSLAIMSAVLALTLARRSGADRSRGYACDASRDCRCCGLGGISTALDPGTRRDSFVVAIVLSVWLRQFGRRATEIGGLIALPFVVILISPVGRTRPAVRW